MTLALFDLDNTLLGGDSDYSWGQFVVNKGLVDKQRYSKANDHFYQTYLDGTLDAVAYQTFSLQPLIGKLGKELAPLHQEFMKEYIEPIWLPKAMDLLQTHRDKGETLVVITATNRFIVQPIVRAMRVDHLICTEPEVIGRTYTGNLIDEPCMGQGKVTKLERWLETQNESLEGACFYSDSHNDLPLLNRVDRPIAVDPDKKLHHIAEENGWPIISLR